MLKAVGNDPGIVDGVNGPKTKAAVKAFQTKAGGLTQDVDAGAKTREKLFAAYMDFLCPMKLAKTEFLGQGVDAGGRGDYQGCSEFNPTMVFSQLESQELNKTQNHPERDRENSVNRRVMILLFRPGTPPSAKWPCPRANEGTAGCRARFWFDGDKRRNPQEARRKFGDTLDTFGCRFYHRLTVSSPCEGVKPPPPKITVTSIEFCLSEKLYLETRPWWPKQDAKPFPGEPFDSKLTNGPKTGVLGDKGCIRLEPIPGGECEVRFPKFYEDVDKLLGLPVPFPVPIPVPVPLPPIPVPPTPKPTTKKEKLILVSVDLLFAPGVETLTVKYDIQDLTGEPVLFTVVSAREPLKIIFEREVDAAEKANGEGKSFEWDGRGADGQRLGPVRSPYTVVLQTADQRFKGNRETKVEIDKIEVAVDAPGNRLFMSDPDHKAVAKATIFLKNKAGVGIVTSLGFSVKFTFTEGGSNTTFAASFVHATPKALGKKGDATALYWESHPQSSGSSPDGFKLSAFALTGNTGANMGVAKVFFLPSGVGGNTYKVKATLAGKSGESPTLTVFRKIVLKPFEMAGQTQVSKNGTTAAMAAFYTPATFVKYELGTVGHLDAKFKVKYVALWDHASQRQLIWDTERKKTAAETPTASETTDANGPAGAAQTTARAAVQARANAWHARIEAVHLAGLQSWATDAGLPVNVIVGVEDRHPKFSANAPESDAVTAEWTAFPWLRITVQGRSLAPDTRWKNVQGFSFERRAYIMAGLLNARARVAVAHEAGHETKNQFKRDLFGVGDHSPAAGLMDTTATVSAFSAREIEILRGIL